MSNLARISALPFVSPVQSRTAPSSSPKNCAACCGNRWSNCAHKVLTSDCEGGTNFLLLLTGGAGAHEVKLVDDGEEELTETSEDEETVAPCSTQSPLSSSHRSVIPTDLLVQVSDFRLIFFIGLKVFLTVVFFILFFMSSFFIISLSSSASSFFLRSGLVSPTDDDFSTFSPPASWGPRPSALIFMVSFISLVSISCPGLLTGS